MTSGGPRRCPWTGDDALMVRCHDEEWGVPLHDDRRWFEYTICCAFLQAGGVVNDHLVGCFRHRELRR